MGRAAPKSCCQPVDRRRSPFAALRAFDHSPVLIAGMDVAGGSLRAKHNLRNTYTLPRNTRNVLVQQLLDEARPVRRLFTLVPGDAIRVFGVPRTELARIALWRLPMASKRELSWRCSVKCLLGPRLSRGRTRSL